MSYNSQITRSRILKCAHREFMIHGYQKTNMRTIAKEANVTTGALYNHFANKQVLFDVLVQAPADELLIKFQEMHSHAKETLLCDDMQETAGKGTDWVLQFIYNNMDAFQLIFCHSTGTKWADYLERLIEIEEQAYRIYCDLLCKEETHIDDMFLHITAAGGFQYIVELVSHNISYDKAIIIMDNVKRYSMAGWYEILRH